MQNVNRLNLFIFLTLSSLTLLGQSFEVGSTQSEFVDYFKAHKDSLEPIEGIWERKTTTTIHYNYHRKSENPTTIEQDIAIVKSNGLYEVFLFSNEVCVSKNPEVCVISQSAIPNRYYFSAKWPSWCHEVVNLAFVIKDNSFSFDYTHDCTPHEDDKYNYQATVNDVWNKLFPTK